ncbi:hypothetical protein D915_000413 [Fasciola hepatica]|uniref:Apple domain-containing protein n=1 Tax=Fasciola hepatica TaxID=6192 RepID=A0A2H1CWA8_FASHE|nr:hypothetical protein D915_000413 [Fasciola hepatica]
MRAYGSQFRVKPELTSPLLASSNRKGHLFTLQVTVMIILHTVSAGKPVFDSTVDLHQTKVSYCEAHTICFLEGQRRGQIGYMAGERFIALFSQLNYSDTLWINVNALLSQGARPNNFDWVYGEKIWNQSFSKLSDQLQKTQNSAIDRVAVYTKEKLITGTNTTDQKFAFLCDHRLDNQMNRVTRKEMFRSNSMLPKSIHALSDETTGCFRKNYEVSLVQCGIKCHRDSACRSLYYNGISSECFRARYVDSLLMKKDWDRNSPGWKRFSRPTWSTADEI